MPWYAGPTLIELLDRVEPEAARLREAAAAAADPGGEPRRAGRPGRDRHRRPPADAATRFACSRPGQIEPRVAHRRRRRRRSSRRRRRAQAVTIALDGAVEVAPRRSDRARPTRPPRSPTSSRRPSSGWPTRRCCAAAATRCASAPRRATASINPLKYKINLSTLDRMAATTLAHKRDRRLQPAARSRAAVRSLQDVNRDTGGFILVDKLSGATVGAGMLHFALRRAQNVALAGDGREQGGARGDQGAEAVRALVHGPVGRRQVDDRQPGRQDAAQPPAATPTCWTATTSATG